MRTLSFVMPGQKREARLHQIVPGIHVFLRVAKTWMAGTSPAMTKYLT
jgi:hypothetical protein